MSGNNWLNRSFQQKTGYSWYINSNIKEEQGDFIFVLDTNAITIQMLCLVLTQSLQEAQWQHEESSGKICEYD